MVQLIDGVAWSIWSGIGKMADQKKGSWLILVHSHKAEKAKQLNAGIPEQNASNQIFIVTLT